MFLAFFALTKKYFTFFLCRISIKTPTKVKAAIAITNPCIAIEGTISAKVENGLFVSIINERIYNIIDTISHLYMMFTLDRLADITGGFEKYKEYIQGMVRASWLHFDDDVGNEITRLHAIRNEHQVDREVKSFVHLPSRKLILVYIKDDGEIQQQDQEDRACDIFNKILRINNEDHIVYLYMAEMSTDYALYVTEASS